LISGKKPHQNVGFAVGHALGEMSEHGLQLARRLFRRQAVHEDINVRVREAIAAWRWNFRICAKECKGENWETSAHTTTISE